MRQPAGLSLSLVLLFALGCNNGSPANGSDAQSSSDATLSDGSSSAPPVYTLPDGATVYVSSDGAVQALDGAFLDPSSLVPADAGYLPIGLADGAVVLVYRDGAVTANDGALLGPRSDAGAAEPAVEAAVPVEAGAEAAVAQDAAGMDAAGPEASATDAGNGAETSASDAGNGAETATGDAGRVSDAASGTDGGQDAGASPDACVAGASCEIAGSCEVGRITCGVDGPACVGTGAVRASGVCRSAPDSCSQNATCNGTSTVCPANAYTCSCETTQTSCEQWPLCNWRSGACRQFAPGTDACADARNLAQCAAAAGLSGCTWLLDANRCVFGGS